MADVEMEKIFEEEGATLKGAEGEGAEVGEAVHEEQAAGHDAGNALNAAMGILVEGEIFFVKGGGECCGMAKGEAEARASHGVY